MFPQNELLAFIKMKEADFLQLQYYRTAKNMTAKNANPAQSQIVRSCRHMFQFRRNTIRTKDNVQTFSPTFLH